MRILFTSAALLIGTACTATPAATTATSGASQVAEADLVCRKMEIIGTRFPKKTCKTQEAWDQYDAAVAEDGKQGLDKIQRQRNATPSG